MSKLTKLVDGVVIENHDNDTREWKNGSRECMDKLFSYEAIGEPGEVVKPVRCEECLHGKPYKMIGNSVSELTGIQCTLLDLFPMWEGDYCSYGEREGGAANASL